MNQVWQDLRFAWRTLRRSHAFAVVAVLTLAVGIGANAAIFSVVNTVLLRPLPFPDSQRIVWIWETDETHNVHRVAVSPAAFLDWRNQSHVFERLSAWRALFFTLTGNGDPEREWGAQVSGDFFRLFRVTLALGRDFTSEEEQPGHEQVVILSYRLWQQRYAGDRNVIGRSITIDYKSYTVIGVLPSGFSVFGTSRAFDLWVPFAFNRAQLNREDHELVVFARLRDGVAIPQAQGEMETILSRLKKQYPDVDQTNGIIVRGFHDDVVSGLKPALLILWTAVIFILLIACANVANLTLARAATREREIAIRTALGAGRIRVLRQLLTESVLLALIGAILGVLVAYVGLHLLRVVLPVTGGRGEIPRAEWIGIDATVLVYTLVISSLTAIILGIAPAIQVWCSELSESLKEGSRGASPSRRGRFVGSSLVVSEVALSLMLLTGAGLLIRSFSFLMSENLGFDPANVLTMQLWLPETHVPSVRQVVGFNQQLIDRLNALPGVKSASAVNFPPLSGWNGTCNFEIRGRTAPPGEQFTSQYRIVDWRYAKAIRMVLKRGRDFAASDGADTPGVAIVNQTLAHQYWPNEDPLGQQVRLQSFGSENPWEPELSRSWLTIVGVAGDVRDSQWGEPEAAQLYLPFVQNPSRIMHLVVRTDGDPMAIAPAARHITESIDPNQPVTELRTMDDLIAAAVAQRRLNMFLLGIFAAVAVILAAAGIYSVMAYGVSQRTHEVGIRMALGAEPGDVLRLMVRDGMRLVGIGLALGILGALAAARYLQTQLYGISAHDPVTIAIVALGLAAVGVAASYFPGRRAANVDPLVALRYE